MSKLVYVFATIGALLVTGCVSNMTTVEWQNDRLLRAAAQGTAFHSSENVRKGVLKKVAEEVHEAGYTHFALVDESTSVQENLIQTSKGSADSFGTVQATGYGTATYSSNTTYTEPTYTAVQLHGMEARFFVLMEDEVSYALEQDPLLAVYPVTQFIEIETEETQ